eukprot:COSAG02_NODE_48860_length_331_cov_0.534483_1_plen_61_part_01
MFAKSTMPGKQMRDKNGLRLTRPQSKIAADLLKSFFDPALGERQWDGKKQLLVQAVNVAFA